MIFEHLHVDSSVIYCGELHCMFHYLQYIGIGGVERRGELKDRESLYLFLEY